MPNESHFPPSVTPSTCCYCGTGCGVLIDSRDGRITDVRGDPEHPANQGRLCAKGATLHLTAAPSTLQANRALYPEVRTRRDQPRQRVSWEQAMAVAARRFAAVIAEHGPEAVAFYVSGQLLTEDYYVFNKLVKGFIGSNNIDTNSRLCMSSAASGYKLTLGVDAPPNCYEDIGLAQCLFITGANPAAAHPIVFRRIEDAREANPELKIIVADPRRSETAAIADLHLALKPGTDIALYNAMLHVLLAENLVDRDYIAAHTEGFAALEAIAADYSPAVAAQICGIPAEDIVQAARWFGLSKASLSLWCQGLNQSRHGSHNNAALIHLHLATGHIGRPGAGPFSLTGQPNAMGGREVGGMANLLSAHRDLGNAEHRAEVARFWGVPEVPAKPGLTAVQLFEAVGRGEVKALWIACTNPAHSLPDQARVRAALETAEFVVLQEAYGDTDTAAYADLLLPAASWGEKEGTVTNSERRISRVRAAVAPAGEARADWAIAVDFAHRLGDELGRGDEARRLFPYRRPEAIFNEHRDSTRGRDLDITGLSYGLLEQRGPQLWPFPAGAEAGLPRLYADGRFPTPSGRARFVPVQHQEVAEPTDVDQPISLLSGRLRDQWHGMSRTGTVPRLFHGAEEAVLAMHPCDLRHRGLEDGDLARVSNGRDSLVLRVAAVAGLKKGRAWLPMHWGSRFMHGAGANAFTGPACDPISLQPELKHAPVQVEKADLPWPLAVVRAGEGPDALASSLALLQRARRLLPRFPYASVGLYGRGQPLVVFRAAAEAPLDEAQIREIDALFDLEREEGAIVYADRRRHIGKRALARDGHLLGVRLAGETQALAWLKDAISDDVLDPDLLRWAVAPISTPPAKLLRSSPVVCKCADITQAQIEAGIARGLDLAGLQNELKCGTFCGGCLPEVKKIIVAKTSPQAA